MVKAKKKNRKIVGWVFLAVLIFIAIVIVANRALVYDWWRGITYTPSDKMAQIRSDLELTGEGEFIFNSVQPRLSDRAEFNAKCRSERDSEIAVLGCFTGDSVFVYNIESEELDGIRELTTAHELLHAVWSRTSADEKTKLYKSLKAVLEDNSGFLKDEMKNYDENERQEELYVRAGTEVKKLPSELEEHYAKYFKDQDGVVSFYDKYIRVFRELEARRDKTKAQIDELGNTIQQKSINYEVGVEQLNEEIVSFNGCAETMGCFESQWAFDTKRAALINKQNGLKALYEEIDNLISQYNQLVEQYNNDVTRVEELNNQINSNSVIKEIDD